MVFGNNIPSGKIQIENDGDNFGVEKGINSGTINVYQGLGYSDTKALCRDIVQDELAKYRRSAAEIAEQRRDEMIDLIIEKLSARGLTDQESLFEFANPAMQFDYLEAQKAYIKAGTPELAAILSDLLVERACESSRTLLQITLGESIQVAPKLIKSQLGSIALLFNISDTCMPSINTHDRFKAYLQDTILPIYNSGVSRKSSEFGHLVFAGCSQYLALRMNLPKQFTRVYSSLFMKGYVKEQLPNSSNGMNLQEHYPLLFDKCLNDEKKLQFTSRTEKELSKTMTLFGVCREDQSVMLDLYKKNIMSEKEAETLIVSLIPEMQDLLDYWKDNDISMQTLTSVGLVIGAQYSKMINGIGYDLNIWV